MSMLLLPAKFMSVGRNRGKIAKQKLTILPSAGFLPNRLLNAFRVFAFLVQKTPLKNLSGQKHRLRLTHKYTHVLQVGYRYKQSISFTKYTAIKNVNFFIIISF